MLTSSTEVITPELDSFMQLHHCFSKRHLVGTPAKPLVVLNRAPEKKNSPSLNVLINNKQTAQTVDTITGCDLLEFMNKRISLGWVILDDAHNAQSLRGNWGGIFH